jgi:tripartite-type tricarboxylate transporter receptor subunit TctC
VRTIIRSLFALACIAVSGLAFCQEYPSKLIKLVVGYAPGSTVDVLGRALADGMRDKLKGNVIIVENRPGADSAIAGNYVRTSAPDGYTLYFGDPTFMHPILMQNQPVDAAKSFAPIASIMRVEPGILVSAKLPVTTFQQLVEYSKTSAVPLQAATVTTQQIPLLKEIAKHTGLRYEVVPFSNWQQILQPIVAGDIAFTINSFFNARLAVDQGTVRPVLQLSSNPSPLYPNVDTLKKLSLPQEWALGAASEFGLWAPYGTDPHVLETLNAAATAAVRDDKFQKVFPKLGLVPVGSTAAQQLSIFTATMKFWERATK